MSWLFGGGLGSGGPGSGDFALCAGLLDGESGWVQLDLGKSFRYSLRGCLIFNRTNKAQYICLCFNYSPSNPL